jgi:hypothetical protein
MKPLCSFGLIMMGWSCPIRFRGKTIRRPRSVAHSREQEHDRECGAGFRAETRSSHRYLIAGR